MAIHPKFRDKINFRDLGGYQATDGRKIKPGLIYRSGGIYLMNPEELDYFSSLGIKNIMDLRTSQESEIEPNPILPNVEMIRHSGLVFRGGEEIDFSPVGMSKIGEEGLEQLRVLKKYYSEMPFDNEAFRILISNLAEGKAPIVFHCATGKDRTGVAAMIILAALGIPREEILRDYLLSNDYHRDTIEKTLRENRHLTEGHPELYELLSMRTGVVEEIGSAVLDSMYGRYSSIEEYLHEEFSLDEAGLTSLRNMYLE